MKKARNIIDNSKVLNAMCDKNIFLLDSDEESIYITDGIDYYFRVDLTKEMCVELSKVFSDLAKSFEQE